MQAYFYVYVAMQHVIVSRILQVKLACLLSTSLCKKDGFIQPHHHSINLPVFDKPVFLPIVGTISGHKQGVVQL